MGWEKWVLCHRGVLGPRVHHGLEGDWCRLFYRRAWSGSIIRRGGGLLRNLSKGACWWCSRRAVADWDSWVAFLVTDVFWGSGKFLGLSFYG